MRTVVTDLLLDTIASICRTIARDETHIVLAGPTGSIKFDALHIACTYLGIKMATITPVKNYSTQDFYNDLKMVIQCVVDTFVYRNCTVFLVLFLFVRFGIQ